MATEDIMSIKYSGLILSSYIGAPSDPGHTPNNLYHVMYWHIKQTMVEGGRQPVDFMVNSRLVID